MPSMQVPIQQGACWATTPNCFGPSHRAHPLAGCFMRIHIDRGRRHTRA